VIMHTQRWLLLWLLLLSLIPSAAYSQTCPPVQNVEVKWHTLSGPGHCDGEGSGWLINHNNFGVDCNYKFTFPNNKEDSGATYVGAGQTKGGEGAGMWACGGPNGFTALCRARDCSNQPPNCPGYPEPLPPHARACRPNETPAGVHFYGANKSCAWCF
jgi:hypothetical protein